MKKMFQMFLSLKCLPKMVRRKDPLVTTKTIVQGDVYILKNNLSGHQIGRCLPKLRPTCGQSWGLDIVLSKQRYSNSFISCFFTYSPYSSNVCETYILWSHHASYLKYAIIIKLILHLILKVGVLSSFCLPGCTRTVHVSFLWLSRPCISSLICTHVCGSSYLLSGLDDTAGLSWWCCCLSGSEPAGVTAEPPFSEARLQQHRVVVRAGGREAGRVAQTPLIRLSPPLQCLRVETGWTGCSAVLKYDQIIAPSTL